MAEIIAFPARGREAEEPDVDLLTAVDTAIRDLRDIARACVPERVREQADQCRALLERAFCASVDQAG
jgi:hypothetical protein